MQPVATGVACSIIYVYLPVGMFFSVGHMGELCKMAEPIKILFGD